MSDLITVTGVVLSTMPIGESDKRVVLLTKERGKITAFARGARRTTSPLLAATNPFVFGSFSVYEGRTSYNLSQAVVKHHFTELAGAQPGVYYGFYFLELADYYAREYTDEMQMINLIYVSLRALLNPKIDDELVRCVFELKTLVIQGEYPQMFACNQCGVTEGLTGYSQSAHGVLCEDCRRQQTDSRYIDESTLYTLQYIISAPLEKLYTFTVHAQVLENLKKLIGKYLDSQLDKKMKSLEILKVML